MPYVIISLISFLINIPFGYIRQNTPKFSASWLFWIHASIPVIVYMRIQLGTSSWFIPFTIFFAVLGQIIGSRWRQGRMTVEDVERLAQIKNLNLVKDRKTNDPDVLVALLNMGGPKTLGDVKDFQERLFADPLLIRFPLSFIFQRFFAWLLIKLRLNAVKERYQAIGGGSPIYRSTTAQAKALSRELEQRGRNIKVVHSFNYSPPLPEETINEAKAEGKKYIFALSLYPHYSKATTGSNLHYLKKASAVLGGPEIIEAPAYYLHNGYIQAFVDRIHESVGPGETLDDFYLLFSAHGLPLYFLKEGDPYPFQITQTISKILAKLDRDKNWTISYQSSVGPLQWLKPDTEQMLKALARREIKKIIVVPVSFVGDHIETVHEINIEYRHVAEKIGIEDFRMSKAIECHSGFIQALADTVESALPKQSGKVYSGKYTHPLEELIKQRGD